MYCQRYAVRLKNSPVEMVHVLTLDGAAISMKIVLMARMRQIAVSKQLSLFYSLNTWRRYALSRAPSSLLLLLVVVVVAAAAAVAAWGLVHCESKNKTPYSCSYFRQTLTGIQMSRNFKLSRKFTINWSLEIPPNILRVATLPCDILTSEN